MIRNIIISLIILYVGEVAFEGDHQALYEIVINYINRQAVELLAYGVAGSFILIAVSFILGALGLFSVMFIISQGVFVLSQLAISLLSVAAVIFWFYFKQNLWWDVGYMVGAIPYLVLSASAFSLKQFDFNYPVGRTIEGCIALPILSGLIIFASVYMTG